MPRPREHDPEAALMGLIHAFWEHGYSGASIATLEQASGLNRRQLARDYGDKRQMFLAALERFKAATVREFVAPIANVRCVADIRNNLLALCGRADTEQALFGCLICNTSHEEAAMADADVAAEVRDYFRQLEKGYARALRRLVASGEVEMNAAGVRRASRALLGTHVSIMVLMRAGEPKALLRDIADHAAASLR